MDKKEFISKLKDIYHHTKRGKYDASYDEFRDMLTSDVVSKSNGGWDGSIALEAMRFAEYIFKVQPEATLQALRTTSADAEAVFGQYLTERAFNYKHIPESEDQSPDGYIGGFNDKYLCELKSPVLMFDHDAAPFGYKFSTIHNKILGAIHKAKTQLETLDPDHMIPHILIYSSAHPQLDCNNFIDAIRGYVANQDGTITTDLRDTEVFKTTKPIITALDLYIWLRISRQGALRVCYFVNSDSIHINAFNRLVDNLKTKPLSAMDIHTNLQDVMDRSV